MSKITFLEESADPSTPSSGKWKVYFKAAGMYVVDDAGRVYGPFLNKRVVAVTQSATPAINVDITDIAQITGLAQAITSLTSGLTGTPRNGQELDIEFTDDGTGRAITHGASFIGSSNAALITTTTANKKVYEKFRYDSVDSVWRCLATTEES